MPVFIFLGWIVGILLAAVTSVAGLVAMGIPVATIVAVLVGSPLAALLLLLAPIVALLGPIGVALATLLAGFSVILVILLILIAIFVAYFVAFLIGYLIATAGVAGSFPPATAFPLPPGVFSVPPPGGAPTPTTPTPAEFFGRGWMIGLNAGCNFTLLMLLSAFDPIWPPVLAVWAFTLISLSAVIFLARNRVFQGFLGWSAWLFPLAYLGTVPGLLLFLFNSIASRLAPPLPGVPPLTVALDFTTGVIESADGFLTRLTRLSGFTGGFTQGNFTFLLESPPPAAFTASSVSTHEIGHSLNTAAMGGVVLWINAVDENVLPFRRRDLAYGELAAESHARLFGTARVRFFVSLWF
jgi:hypothetical protein